MAHVGERIKKRRKELKLTLADVALEKMSAAMVSLIENGKSKPSAENLQHISRQLRLSVEELLGELTKEELKGHLEYIDDDWDRVLYDKQLIESKMDYINNLLPKLGTNYESARIFEAYASLLFTSYLHHHSFYKTINDGNWNHYFMKAKNLYFELDMVSRVNGVHYKITEIESLLGNYQKVIELVEVGWKEKNEPFSYDALVYKMDLLFVRSDAYLALGDFEKCLEQIEQIEQMATEHLLFRHMYQMYNVGIMISYHLNQLDNVKIFKEKFKNLITIAPKSTIQFDKELMFIHYIEFFEDEPNEALRLLEDYEQKLRQSSLPEQFITAYHEFVQDNKARCYTKLNNPEKALSLFRELPLSWNQDIKVHPFDIILRNLSKSYQAECLLAFGEHEKALELANDSVQTAKKFPHTVYYQFARNVLSKVQKAALKKSRDS